MTSPRNRIVLPAVINKQKVNKTSASRCSNQRRTLIIHKHRFNGGLASFMSERQQSPYDSTARSWLALVERRQRNFIELCNTGRWRHYYTHAQFLDETRKVLHLTHPMGAAGRLAGQRANRVPTKHQTKRSAQPGCRCTKGKAVVTQRVWAAAAARVGDFGRRSRASLRRWTQRR